MGAANAPVNQDRVAGAKPSSGFGLPGASGVEVAMHPWCPDGLTGRGTVTVCRNPHSKSYKSLIW
ncbi:hypothetical protein GCM10010195_43750 [Kitasatospora griseola]|nr:hypothetical protein GCM10010195_43750 [Kitasatospora griseola]